MSRPTTDETMMALALAMAQRSTCLRHSVGCVLTDQRGRVLSTGYNGVVSGALHCNQVIPISTTFEKPQRSVSGAVLNLPMSCQSVLHPELSEDGRRLSFGWLPHACQGHDLPPGRDGCEAVHAEQNALIQCRDADAISTAYVTLSPCKACLKLLLNTGCNRIVFAEELHDTWSRNMWLKVGRKWEKLDV